MAEKVPQNLANHGRFDPLYHFFALPVTALTVIVAIIHFVQRPNWFSGWLVVFTVAVVIIALRTRAYPLKAQDRIIRLEERERLVALLSEPLRSRVGELSEAQLIGLRFSSDAEIPDLVPEALAKQLSRTDIKKLIKNWRADYFRV
ncbi:MAG TPA: DUF6526 family protein [Terriglobales bacterium]|nr:DUF6526 family protein [Terriglobales bacterium]